MEHYRFYIVYVNKTRAERIADMVHFLTDHNKIPGVSNQEASTNASLYLIEDITKPAPTSLFASIEASNLQAIRNLADIFKQTTYEREYLFYLPSVGNDILNKTTQETIHKDTVQTRLEVKHSNQPKTTVYTMVQLSSKRQTQAPTEIQNLKPTPFVSYE